MKKYIIFFSVISLTISLAVQLESKTKFIHASENRGDITTNKNALNNSLISNQQNKEFFNIVKKPFDSHLIGTYTGLPKALYTDKGILNGIYVTGTKNRSGNQLLTVYSKDETAATNIINIDVERNTLKIYIQDNKPNPNKEKNIVYQIKTFKTPEKFEVICNGNLEDKRLILYKIIH